MDERSAKSGGMVSWCRR